jgi:hypothetical protein
MSKAIHVDIVQFATGLPVEIVASVSNDLSSIIDQLQTTVSTPKIPHDHEHDHDFQQLWVPHVVTVEVEYDLTRGKLQPGIPRVGNTSVLSSDHSNTRISNRSCYPQRIIRASVVDNDQFPILVALGNDRVDRHPDATRSIVDRHDDANRNVVVTGRIFSIHLSYG